MPGLYNASAKDVIWAAVYFSLSAFFTWLFVAASPLYISKEQMMLSSAIAGGKWSLQILFAIVFLNEKTWTFIKNIGFVCFIGSCILLPYLAFRSIDLASQPKYFVGSLIVSVITMIALYFRATNKSGVKKMWWYGWLLCLVIAVSLQLTVVFHVI
jgi:hypothetical protein